MKTDKVGYEKTDNGIYYAISEIGNGTAREVNYVLYKENKVIVEAYIRRNGLFYKVDEDEEVIKDLQKAIRKFELTDIFNGNKKEVEGVITYFKEAKATAAIVEDIENELDTYLNEEMVNKKKRLAQLEMNNYSDDLYHFKYKKHINHKEFHRIFENVNAYTVIKYI